MHPFFAATALGVLTAVAGCSAAGRAHPVTAAPSHTANSQPAPGPSIPTDTRCLAALPKRPNGVILTDTRVIYLHTTRPLGAGATLTGTETHWVPDSDDDGHYDPVGPVHSYRVAADATVVLLDNAPILHQLCTDVHGMLALAPGANDPAAGQPLNDGLYDWDSHRAAIKTDHAGTITRIEELYSP
jgi:hypothetical protein